MGSTDACNLQSLAVYFQVFAFCFDYDGGDFIFTAIFFSVVFEFKRERET